jgi:hypothetical protein
LKSQRILDHKPHLKLLAAHGRSLARGATIDLGFLITTTLPAQAFWIERNPNHSGTWLIHCKNREDYPLRVDRADAVEAARTLCYELTAREEHGVNYRAAVFY